MCIRDRLKEMARQGHPFTGILYAGLMMTKDGPKVLEYNVRFGDPECQPLLMRLENDLLDIMGACIDGRLHEVPVSYTHLDVYKRQRSRRCAPACGDGGSVWYEGCPKGRERTYGGLLVHRGRQKPFPQRGHRKGVEPVECCKGRRGPVSYTHLPVVGTILGAVGGGLLGSVFGGRKPKRPAVWGGVEINLGDPDAYRDGSYNFGAAFDRKGYGKNCLLYTSRCV